MIVEQSTNYAYKLKYMGNTYLLCASIATRMRAKKAAENYKSHRMNPLWEGQ